MSGTRPNVLFVTLDQWRADALGVTPSGHPVRTPNLDALAADGTLFRSHWVQCAPCGPSRASLLTGLYLMNHRSCTNGTPLDARFANLATEARAAGYVPALFGYTDTSLDPRTLPANDPRLTSYEEVLPGFEPVCHLPFERMGPWIADLRSKGYDVTDDPRDAWRAEHSNPDWASRGEPPGPGRIHADDTETAFLTNRFLEWLGDRGSEPWFAHLSYLRPHPPWIASPPYDSMFDAGDTPAPRPPVNPDSHPWLAWKARPPHPALSRIADHRAAYYGLVAEVDHHLGRILARLSESEETSHTLVVVTSDHGEQLGDDGMVGKAGWFDPSYQVPLIVRHPDPDRDRGHVVDHFTENVDILPTILDVIGRPLPPSLDGRSLLPFLSGKEPRNWRTAAFWEYDFRDPETRAAENHFGLDPSACSLSVLRTRTHKLVHFAADLPSILIPLNRGTEDIDLADDPAHQSLLLEMTQRLLSLRMRHAERTLTHLKITPQGLVEDPPS